MRQRVSKSILNCSNRLNLRSDYIRWLCPVGASGFDEVTNIHVSVVDMAKLELKLVGVVVFLVAALEAQETPASESVTTPNSQTVGETQPVTPGNTTLGPTGEGLAVTGTTLNGTDITGAPDNSTVPSTIGNNTENGGDPFVKPGKHRPGLRHVKAHDGFHNLRTEKYWAHWNDAFTTSLPNI
ncbi:uncharacterized protein LOC108098366 [Drosophila ficusphila]|uniref:uncharacterized protein LOC108098366 n=1 Tax=Drosophila ficusphila TaxID=30025 RepID=UPI0007E7A687|nr:uncharacterized protein LOC108098366 [Drosophila ficusphila]